METSVTTTSKATAPRHWVLPFVGALTGFLVLQIANLGFTPLVPLMQKDWSANFGQIGLFLGLGGPLLILMSLPAGEVVRRLGEKTAVLALILIAVGLALIGLAPNFLLGLIGRVIWAASYVYVFVGLVTAAALASPGSSKSSVMGIVGAAGSLAAAVGATLVGTIASILGWRSGFFADALLSILGLVVFLILYRRRSVHPSISTEEAALPDQPAALPGKAQSRSVYRSSLAWILAAFTALGTMGGVATLLFFPTYLEGAYHLSTPNAAFIASGGAIIGIVANLLSGYLSDRVGRWLMLGIILVLCLISTLLLATLAADNLVVGAIFGALVVGLALCLPNLNNAIAAYLTADTKGEVGPIIGMLQFMSGVGVYVGPQVLGLLRGATGTFVAGWYFVSAVFAVAIIILFYLVNHVKRGQAL
jgi:predicted MFS family arabinose efflux permease